MIHVSTNEKVNKIKMLDILSEAFSEDGEQEKIEKNRQKILKNFKILEKECLISNPRNMWITKSIKEKGFILYDIFKKVSEKGQQSDEEKEYLKFSLYSGNRNISQNLLWDILPILSSILYGNEAQIKNVLIDYYKWLVTEIEFAEWVKVEFGLDIYNQLKVILKQENKKGEGDTNKTKKEIIMENIKQLEKEQEKRIFEREEILEQERADSFSTLDIKELAIANHYFNDFKQVYIQPDELNMMVYYRALNQQGKDKFNQLLSDTYKSYDLAIEHLNSISDFQCDSTLDRSEIIEELKRKVDDNLFFETVFMTTMCNLVEIQKEDIDLLCRIRKLAGVNGMMEKICEEIVEIYKCDEFRKFEVEEEM